MLKLFRNIDWWRVLAVGAFVVSALTFFVPNGIKDIVKLFAEYPELWVTLRILIIAIPYALLIFIYSRIRNKRDNLLKDRDNLVKEIERLYADIKVNTIERYNDIDETIKFGHVSYHPFTYYLPGDDQKPVGVGIEILKKVLGNNNLLEYYNKKSTWSNILEGLRDGEYDIVATPLFETNRRSREVAFTIPIFFADIGIYVRPDLFNLHDKFEGRSFEETLKDLRARNDIYAEVIIGELSEQMVEKHLILPDAHKYKHDKLAVSITGLLNNLIDSNKKYIVFAERFLAESREEVNNHTIVNILKPCELTYSVGYAIRREEYVFRNYLNYKISELNDRMPIHCILTNELRKHGRYQTIQEDKVCEYFLRYDPRNSYSLK